MGEPPQAKANKEITIVERNYLEIADRLFFCDYYGIPRKPRTFYKPSKLSGGLN
jgi:hypothetical protein